MSEKKMTAEKWGEAEKLLNSGLQNKIVAEQFGISPGRLSQRFGKRRNKPADAPQSLQTSATPEKVVG